MKNKKIIFLIIIIIVIVSIVVLIFLKKQSFNQIKSIDKSLKNAEEICNNEMEYYGKKLKIMKHLMEYL